MDLAYAGGRYSSEVIKVIQEIADSHFVAFDLEFSGIAERSQQRSPGKPSLQELYAETKVAAVKYQVLQVGLAIVQEDIENGQYIVKPYNFNINPLPTLRERVFMRDWSMSSGAVQFLLKNRFDFALPLTNGIPYLSRAEEVQARSVLSGETDRKRPDMILKTEDDVLVKHIKDSITVWEQQGSTEKEKYLNIPNDSRGKGVPGVLNRYQMRLTHQIIQNEFPQLKTTSMREFVQVTNPSPEERNRQKTMQQEHIDREIGKAIGFRWILEAMAGQDISGMPDECFLAAVPQFPQARGDLTPFHAFVSDLNTRLSRRRKVLIGHNCFTDLIYLHHFFLGELPDQVEDFQRSIHENFPAVIDTKFIASFGNGRWGDTSLSAVEEELREQPEPNIVVPSEFDRYASNEKPHEAGYDAMLTANIAIKLSAKMEREAEYLEKEETKEALSHEQRHPEQFGSNELQDSVTASKDSHALLQDNASKDNVSEDLHTEKQADQIVQITNTGSQNTSSESHQPSTTSSTSILAVKEKKATQINWNSSKEVEKVKSAFVTANIYDILDQDTDSKSESVGDDLMSFSDPDSPDAKSKAALQAEQRAKVADMVKQGKLMPRWDKGNGFWQIFGNKLQVNSCKDGVCEL